MLTIKIITIFPNIFNDFLNTGIVGRAIKKGVLKVEVFDLRKWTKDNHKTIDKSPFGGGAGMIMMLEPIYEALEELDSNHNAYRILTSPRGEILNQNISKELSQKTEIIFIAGHYEGVDQRVTNYLIDKEISIGKYILSGGEVPVMVVIDTVTRLLKDSLGNTESLKEESFNEENYLEYDQYTRPEEFITKDKKKLKVPEVLLSGNHEEIRKWREKNSKESNTI